MTSQADHNSVVGVRPPQKTPSNLLVASRFEAWQDILGQLRTHFRLISSAEAAHNKQLRKLVEAVPRPFSKYALFEQGGSVQGLGSLLHDQSAGRVSHSDHILRALDGDIIPNLEQTEEHLKERVAHIREMQGDFSNELSTDLDHSKHSLAALQSAIHEWETNKGAVPKEKDPFVVDLMARKHLRSVIAEENYVRETSTNLEKSAKDLESLIVHAIDIVLSKYNELVSTEAAELANMSQKVEQSILAGHLNTEWSSFTKRQYDEGVLIDPTSHARSLETTQYPGKDHVSTAPICDGWLEKKSKFLNNYSAAFYIISPARYLHEFRSNDLRLDAEPTFTLHLPECEIASMSKESDAVHRIVLKGASGSVTLRAKSREDLLKWYLNIGRASDPAFQFHVTPAHGSSAPVSIPATLTELEHDDADHSPFRGPETVVISQPTPRRPAAGRFDTGGFATAWDAAAAALHARPPTSRRDSETSRLATTSYGTAMAETHESPATYPEHDEHLRQASTNSAAAHFIDKEILDDNAYLEYDKVHGTHSTLVGDEDFKPADSNASVTRASSINSQQNYRPRRSSSLAFKELPGSPISSQVPQKRSPRVPKAPSRKATATYGDLSSLHLPSMSEERESGPQEPYISPYFPAPGAGTTGALPASNFAFASGSTHADSVSVAQPTRASATNSGVNTPMISGQPRAPSRKMSLSEQILHSSDASGAATPAHHDLEPHVLAAIGTHDDTRSPYPVVQRFRIPRSRQGSLLSTAPDAASEPMEAYDVAPHMRVGTQSNEARYKVGSRRGSRSASVAATPQEATEPSLFDRSALDSLSADSLAVKLNQPSTGEMARARRAPSRGASMDLGDSTASASPAFNVNNRHTFRKPPSRGSSLSLGNLVGGAGNDAHGLLNTISETFEKDLANALGNRKGDHHIPGEYNPGESVS